MPTNTRKFFLKKNSDHIVFALLLLSSGILETFCLWNIILQCTTKAVTICNWVTYCALITKNAFIFIRLVQR